MPIYEYECHRCHHRFEIKQAFRDDPIRECPLCQGPVRRVLYPAGIVFKGPGFYVTDNRKLDSAPTPLSSKSIPDEGIKEKEGEKAGTRKPVAAKKGESTKTAESKAEEKITG